MKLFLDTSVLLCACGSGTGASRYLIEEATTHGWRLITSAYCIEETQRNLGKLPPPATAAWKTNISPLLGVVDDRVSLDKPLIFAKSKDRPVVITALAAECAWLLTLDEGDFHRRLGRQVYALGIATPGEFLARQRRRGKI